MDALVEVCTGNDIPCQGGVRHGCLAYSGASCTHGDFRQLSTHLCEPVHLVQVWLPERGSQVVRCFVVTLGPSVGSIEFQWLKGAKEGHYGKQTAKDTFSICGKGRSPET